MQLTKIFTGWEAKEKIFRPVIVNLLTASIIFLAAVVFKEPLYNYFERKDPKWPIYCVLEPHVNPDGTEGVTVDLFVINTEAQDYTGEQLAKLSDANANASGGLSKVSPVIRIAPEDGLPPDAITQIVPDGEFNTGKGEGVVMPLEPGKAYREIKLAKIQAHGILKFIISTTEKRPVHTRGDLGTVPITVDYARSQ